MRLTTILELGEQHGLPLPAQTVEGLRPHVVVQTAEPGVMAFIARFHWMQQILVDENACRRVAYENVEDAVREGLDYVELRFSPQFMAEAHGLNPHTVTEAVCDGTEAGRRDFNLPVGLIGILSRTYGANTAWDELDALLSCHEKLAAIDLAGDEARFPADLFIDHFRRIRERGLNVTVHAGESAGVESIRQAIHLLGAQRIGHGIRALDDRALMDELAEKRIALECCLTSNVQTMTVANYASHPIRQFLEHGILATLNTDDPGISGIDLAYEYNIAAPAAGLSTERIRQAQANAQEAAFLQSDEKNYLKKK